MAEGEEARFRSGRYRRLEPEFYVPGPGRKLVQEGKPGAYVVTDGTPAQHKLVDEAVKESCRTAYAAYLEMLDAGVAREVARTVLPVGIYSSMYATCNAGADELPVPAAAERGLDFPLLPSAGDRDGRRVDGGRVGAPDAAHPRRLRAQRPRLPVAAPRRKAKPADDYGHQRKLSGILLPAHPCTAGQVAGRKVAARQSVKLSGSALTEPSNPGPA